MNNLIKCRVQIVIENDVLVNEYKLDFNTTSFYVLYVFSEMVLTPAVNNYV